MPATQKQFLDKLGLLAKVCEYQLSPDLVALYDRALRKFGYDRAITAIEEAIIERRGNDRMPSIGDLAGRCSPQILDGDTAVEVAGRIWTAISEFGQYRGADAANWIGEVGWYVITHSGGWEKICQTAQIKDVGTWKAQLRDHAAAALRRHKAGVLGNAPKFGEVTGSNKIAALVGDVIKKREEYHVSSTGNNGGVPRPPQPGQLDAQSNAGVPETVQGGVHR
jgi:hypothetical protein